MELISFMKFLKLFFLLIGFVFISCNEDKSKVIADNLVSDKEYIQLLNEVLSDTVNLKLIPSKKVVIANCNIVSSPVFHLGKISKLDYLCLNLKESDTLFIKKQYKDSINFDSSELKNFGFEIYDLKSKIDKVEFDSIKLEIEKINISNGKPEYFNTFSMLNRPIVNKKRDRIYVRINRLAGGQNFILVKKNNTWKIESSGQWMH